MMPARSEAAALGLVAGVYCWLAFVFLPTGAHWSPDTGFKRIQAANVRLGGGLDLSIDYPGQRLDPSLRYLPFGKNFYYAYRGRLHFAQPPIIAVLSKPFIGLMGDRGERFLPLLAGLASVYMVAALSRALGVGPAWAGVLLAGLATPMLFFSQQFWEHTLAVALGLGALRLARGTRTSRGRTRLLLSGLLVAVAVVARKEMILYAVCLGAVVAVPGLSAGRWRRPRAWHDLLTWCLPFLAVLAVYDATVVANSGNLVPPELRISARLGPTPRAYLLAQGIDGLADFVLDFRLNRGAPRGALLLLLVGVYWIAGRLPWTRWRQLIQIAALSGFGIGVADFTWRLHLGNGLFGLLSASPFLVLGLAQPSNGVRGMGTLWLLGPGFFALAALALGLLTTTGPAQAGLEWGTRYALAAYPLGTILALHGLRTVWAEAARSWLARLHLALAIGLIGLSLGVEVLGLREVRWSTDTGRDIRSGLLALPERQIVTDLFWISARMPDVYVQKELYAVDTVEALAEWGEAAHASGVRRFAYVSFTLPDPERLAGAAFSGTRLEVIEIRSLTPSLSAVRVEMGAAP